MHRIAFHPRHGLLYIPAEVGRHSGILIVDTGAGLTAFNKKIAPPNRLDKMVTLNLARGTMYGFRVPVDFTLGRSDLNEERCLFHRDMVVGDFMFDGADGVIALGVLSSFKAVTFDFQSSTLVLEDR